MRDHRVEAEEVGQREGEHVQRVRLDGGAEEQQPAQLVDARRLLDAERVLERRQRRHRVVRRADRAHARDDPLDVEEVLADEERLVVAAALEDVHVDLVDRCRPRS